MGDFLITDSGSGKKFRVKGDSMEGAVAALKKMLGVEAKPAEDIVATTQDGGRVIRGAEGNLSFTSPSYSTSDPAQIEKIMQGATPAETSKASFDEATLAQAPVAARAAKFLQGVPFAGQYVDEAAGAMFGDDAKQGIRSVQGAMDRQNPGEAIALQLGGGIVGSIPIALAAPVRAFSALSGLGSRAAAGAAGGAAFGAVEGAVSGYGRGNDGNRLQTSVGDGILGTVFGGVLGAAAPAIGAGVKRAWESLKGRDLTVIASTLGVSDDAARVIKSAIENDDIAAATAALQKAGPDASLAQAGPALASTLDTATKASGKAARIASDAIEPLASRAKTKLDTVMDAVLGPVAGIKSIARGISSRTSAIREAAYKRAYSLNVDYSTGGKGNAVLSVLDRVPPRILNAAIQKADELMRMTPGTAYKQIMASIGPDGKVTFQEMPNVMQLDFIKRGIGRVASEEVDSFGRPLDGGALNALSRDLGAALGDAVPQYKTAVKLGGDKIAEDKALTLGQKLLTRNVTREQVAEWVAGAPSREAKDALGRGLRTQIDETLANVQRTITDPNVDAREAMLLVKSLSSRANQEKVEAALGPARAQALFKVLDEATSALEARSIVARNSDTFRRTAMDQTMRDNLEQGPLGYLKQGEVGQSVKRLVQILTGNTRAASNAKLQETYAEIADALTRVRGPQAEQALQTIQAALAGQPMSTAQAELIAQVLARSVALTGYQLGTRYLPSQSGAR